MQMSKTGAIKPYNIADVGENDAEVTMFGEVVDTRPTDFWTGQPIEGNFIALDEFLRDLDGLKDKSNITIHLNSVGGDLYAGVSIYNRLKGLQANITTVNDGLAASAGSLIFMAGKSRKMNAGSNLMIHQAAGFLYGYYQTNDLKQVIKQLDAGNKAGINIYAEATGLSADTIKAQVDRESWFTGQEAVDAGYATELVEGGEPISMSLTPDRTHMIVNGVSLSTRGMSNIPARIPVMPAASVIASAAAVPGVDKKTKEGSKKDMEIKNLDELKAAFPELVAQAETAAREEGRAAGVADERARIQGIEGIQNAIADKALINSAKFGDTPLTAEQLAFKAMQAQAAIGANVLNAMQEDSKASGAAAVAAAPNNGPEASAKVDEPDPKKEAEEAVKLFNMMKGSVK